MADNVTLNAGSGGATVRSYADSSGVEHPAAVAVYLTTIADGANVVQEVTPSTGLPVAQQGAWTVQPGNTANTTPWLASISEGGNTAVVDVSGRMTVNAVQSGAWAVSTVGSIASPVAATQSGTWNVGTVSAVTSIINPVDVMQSGSWTVSAAQSGTWTVGLSAGQTLADVTTVGSITNPVTVAQPTAGNLNATVTLAAAQTLANVTTVGSITSPVAATQSGTWNVATVDTITNPVAVTQSGAWDIGTVSAVTSITNPVGVTQSGSWAVSATQSGSWTVGLSAGQTLANVTTVGAITNPVAVTQSGTWNAGISAGTNLIGKASAGADTSTIYNGATALTPKFAKIAASASGDNVVVAAVSGKKIRVLEWGLTASGTVGVKWRSNATDLTGVRPLIQYASAGGSYSPIGRFETAPGEALNLNLSSAVPVGGDMAYVEV